MLKSKKNLNKIKKILKNWNHILPQIVVKNRVNPIQIIVKNPVNQAQIVIKNRIILIQIVVKNPIVNPANLIKSLKYQRIIYQVKMKIPQIQVPILIKNWLKD
jgi:hypothetical protein